MVWKNKGLYLYLICFFLLILSFLGFKLNQKWTSPVEIQGSIFTLEFPNFQNVSISLQKDSAPPILKAGVDNQVTFNGLDAGTYNLLVSKNGMNYETEIVIPEGSMNLWVPTTEIEVKQEEKPTSIALVQNGKTLLLDTNPSGEEISYLVFDNGIPYEVQIEQNGKVYKEEVARGTEGYIYTGKQMKEEALYARKMEVQHFGKVLEQRKPANIEENMQLALREDGKNEESTYPKDFYLRWVSKEKVYTLPSPNVGERTALLVSVEKQEGPTVSYVKDDHYIKKRLLQDFEKV